MSTRTTRTDKLKYKIIEEAEINGFELTAKKYKVHASLIYKWRRKLELKTPTETVPAQLLPLLQSENGNGKRHATIDEAITLFKVKRDFYNEVLAMLETLK